MNAKLLTGLLAATTTFAGLATADVANAIQLDQSLYNRIYNQFVQQERDPFSNPEQYRLTPGSLQATGGDVTSYFVTEGAAYINRLLYSVNGGNSQYAFDGRKIASDDQSLLSINTDSDMTRGEGDGLGSFAQGTTFDFSLQSKVWYEGWDGYTVGADESQNPDGLQHLLAFNYFDDVTEENYVILAFEDILGDGSEGSNPYGQASDRDFNDAIFAFKGLTIQNKEVPEPGMTLALLGLAAAGLSRYRRRTRSAK